MAATKRRKTIIPTMIKNIIKKGSPKMALVTINPIKIIPMKTKSIFLFEVMIYVIERGF